MVSTSVGLNKKAYLKLFWLINDCILMTWRSLLKTIRIPESLFWNTIQPVMFVVLFRYVFGGAISLALPKSVPYVDYLMPGIFVQTVLFGAASSAVGLAEDLQKGLVERFKSLPMYRIALLAGRTFADLIRNIFVVLIMTTVGFMVGFRIQTSLLGYVEGVGIILLFAYALSWGMVLVGLFAPNSEVAQVMSFPVIFPFTFASSAFVPVFTMPSWLQGFATYQPVSEVATVARSLMATGHLSDRFLLEALGWAVGALLLFFILSLKYFNSSQKLS